MNAKCANDRLSQWKGSEDETTAGVPTWFVSIEGFTPVLCAAGVPDLEFIRFASLLHHFHQHLSSLSRIAFFVGRTCGAGKILWLDLLDTESYRAPAWS